MTAKNAEHAEKQDVVKEAPKVPEVLTAGQVIRLVTEVMHGLSPQPDPVIMKDILNELQARLHGAA